ncbi:MAG: hypothetical protein V7641_997 [Blastocatellia bacterium]
MKTARKNQQSLKMFLLLAQKRLSLLAVLLLLLNVPSGFGQDNWELYRNAIKDAAVYNRNKVLPLRLLQPEAGRVQVVTFTSYAYKVGPYHVPAGRFIWVTPDGEVQGICRQFNLQGAQLTLRLAQLIGLPPNTQNTSMVVFSVPVDRIFRPTPDPNPMTIYPCAASEMSQCGNQLPANVPAEFKTFFINQALSAYRIGQTEQENGYPWTHLGYTYNWTPYAASKYGASEYVITPDTEVMVISRTPSDQYCAPLQVAPAQKQK